MCHGNRILGYTMNITFSTNASGQWQEIRSFTNVGDGRYAVRPRNMTERNNKTYYWKVNVTDGTTTETKTYQFEIVHHLGDEITYIAMAQCWKYPSLHNWVFLNF